MYIFFFIYVLLELFLKNEFVNAFRCVVSQEKEGMSLMNWLRFQWECTIQCTQGQIYFSYKNDFQPEDVGLWYGICDTKVIWSLLNGFEMIFVSAKSYKTRKQTNIYSTLRIIIFLNTLLLLFWYSQRLLLEIPHLVRACCGVNV